MGIFNIISIYYQNFSLKTYMYPEITEIKNDGVNYTN